MPVQREFLAALLCLSLVLGFTNAVAQDDAPVAGPGHSEPAELATLAQLRRGGNLIFFRHERTEMLRQDDPHVVLDDCSTQRNLSVAGVANSQQTGVYIRHLRIPIEDVVASPMCRTMETARYIFGGATVEGRLWSDWTTETRSVEAQIRDFKALLANHIKPGVNRVMVGHFNGGAVYGLHLEEGDAIVFTNDGSGAAKVVGVIGAHRWGDLIHDEINAAR